MSYIDQNLVPGETVHYRTRFHWIVLVRPFIIAAVLAAIAIGMFYEVATFGKTKSNEPEMLGIVGLVLLLIATLAVVGGIVKRSATEMAVTNRRVLIKVGKLSRKSIEISLSKIESIAVDQTITGRMFNFGTITVRGTGGTPEPFEKIARPMEFRKQVQQQMDGVGIGTR